MNSFQGRASVDYTWVFAGLFLAHAFKIHFWIVFGRLYTVPGIELESAIYKASFPLPVISF